MPGITVFTNSDGPLTKQFALNQKGQLQKTSSTQLTAGDAQVVDVPDLSALKDLHASLKPNQAITYGIPKGGVSQTRVTTAQRPRKGSITRTRQSMDWPEGVGVLFLDLDLSEDMPARMMGAVVADPVQTIRQTLPVLDGVGMLVSHSASSFIYQGSQQLKGVGGFHIYLFVDDARQIPRIGEVFCKKLWLRGYGFIKVSRIGSLLERQLIDAAVFQPERLDYAAAPVCHDNLQQRRPSPLLLPGTVLTAASVQDLSLEELSTYQQLVYNEKQAAKPASDAARADYIATEAQKLAAADHCKDVNAARKVIQQRITPDKNGRIALAHEDVLDFDNQKLGAVTVRDVLVEPARYHQQSLRDPHFPEKGRCKAKLYANKDGSILINSFLQPDACYHLLRYIPTKNNAVITKIIDAPCGFGKSKLLIKELKHLSRTQPEMRFLVVLPELGEVNRFAMALGPDWNTPSAEDGKKIDDLVRLMEQGANVVTTHALYKHIRKIEDLLPHYHVVIDEVPTVAEEVSVGFGPGVFKNLISGRKYIEIDPVTKRISATRKWYQVEEDYTEAADLTVPRFMKKVIHSDVYFVSGIFCVMPLPDAFFVRPKSLKIATFMFEGTQLDHYMRLRNYEYRIVSPPGAFDRFLRDLKKNLLVYNGSIKDATGYKVMTGKDPKRRKQVAHFTRNTLMKLKRTGQPINMDRVLVAASKDAWNGKELNPRSKVTDATRLKSTSNLGKAAYTALVTRGTNKFIDRNILFLLGTLHMHPNLAQFLGMQSKAARDAFETSELIQLLYRTAIRRGEKVLLVSADKSNIRLIDRLSDRVNSACG